MSSNTVLPIHHHSGLRALGFRRDGRPIFPILGSAPAATDTAQHPVLARLMAQRAERETFIAGLLDQVETEDRDLVEAERNLLTAARERIEQLDEQIDPLEQTARTVAAHRASTPTPPSAQDTGGDDSAGGTPLARTTPRPTEYRTAGEFLVDYARARGAFGMAPDDAAAERVRSAAPRALVQTRAAEPHQTTEETPGLLPKQIVGAIETDLDESRPFIASFGTPQDLASIPGKTFSRPTVTQHTEVGEQSAEKAELPMRQWKVEGIDFLKRTFGGWLNVSRQEIDWTNPAAWNGLIADLQNEYGAETDDQAATDFATGVTQTVPAADGSIESLIKALYQAAATSARGGTVPATQKRPSALRLPNHIWVSLDQWAALGAAIDSVRALVMGSSEPGQSSVTNFTGSILDIPRTMVPGLPDGSLIVGRTQKFEVYEQRIGLLQAVEPKVFGVEVAYGGYAAWGFLDKTAFTKVTTPAA